MNIVTADARRLVLKRKSQSLLTSAATVQSHKSRALRLVASLPRAEREESGAGVGAAGYFATMLSACGAGASAAAGFRWKSCAKSSK